MTFIALTVTIVAYLINIKVGTVLAMLGILYILLSDKKPFTAKLIKAIVYSAPFYVFSFWGTHYRFSMCTLLSLLLCVILTVTLFKRGAKINRSAFFLLVLLALFFLSYSISAFGSKDMMETLANTFQLLILGYLIFIIQATRKVELLSANIDTEELMNIFAIGVCAIAMGIYIQFALYQWGGIRLGEVFIYGSGRKVFNLYVYAKSALSLYLAIGLIYYYIKLFRKFKLNNIVIIIFILGAIVLNNSRTGLASFAISAILYTIVHFRKAIRSVKITAMLIILAAAAFCIIQMMLLSRTGLDGIADDNGRFDLIFIALKMLPQHIVIGIGGSAADYAATEMGITVHNFIVAFLIQFGCIGGFCRCYFTFNNMEK